MITVADVHLPQGVCLRCGKPDVDTLCDPCFDELLGKFASKERSMTLKYSDASEYAKQPSNQRTEG